MSGVDVVATCDSVQLMDTTDSDVQQLSLRIPTRLLARVDETRWRERWPSRNHTILRLIEDRLDEIEPPQQHPDQLELDLEIPGGRQ